MPPPNTNGSGSHQAGSIVSKGWTRRAPLVPSNAPELRVGADGLLEGRLLLRGEVGGKPST